MPQKESARLVRELASHGYTADREAITLLSGVESPTEALVAAVEAAPDDELKLSAANVRDALGEAPRGRRDPISGDDSPDDAGEDRAGATAESKPGTAAADSTAPAVEDPPVSTGTASGRQERQGGAVPVETKGSGGRSVNPELRELAVGNDMTGRSPVPVDRPVMSLSTASSRSSGLTLRPPDPSVSTGTAPPRGS